MVDVAKREDRLLDVISALTKKRDKTIHDMTEFALADPTLEGIMLILIAELR